MSNPSKSPPSPRLIFFALLMGQLLFAFVAFVIRSSGRMTALSWSPQEEVRFHAILMAIGIVLLTVTTAAAALVPAFFKPGDLRQAPTQKALLARQIVRMALLEAPALFGIVIYLLTGSLGGLAVTATAIAFFFVIAFPRTPQPISDR